MKHRQRRVRDAGQHDVHAARAARTDAPETEAAVPDPCARLARVPPVGDVTGNIEMNAAAIDFVIIGAQKSASTYVHRLLEQSSEVFMPRGEVRSFEDPHYGHGGAEKIERIIASGQGRKVGIKRPGYLGRPEVPRRIHEQNAATRLILVLRDPVERFRSAYYHYVKLGFAPVADINAVIPQILSGEYQKKYRKLEEILPYGMYHDCLENYRQYFDRRSILIIEKEDLGDRDTLIRKLEGFLEITIDRAADVPFWSSNQGVYDATRLRFLRLRNRLCYRYNEDMSIRWRRKNVLATLVNSLFYTVDRMLLVRVFGNEKPPLSAASKELLDRYYRCDQERLRTDYLDDAP